METLRDYVEWGLTHCDKTASAEGVPLVMEKCVKNKKMKQLEVYGNSVQNGTPTPEAPVEVESVGEKCTKNLFRDDYIPATHTIAGVTADYEGNGIFHLYGAFNGTGTNTYHLTVNMPFDNSLGYIGYVKLLSGTIPGRIVPYFGIGSKTVSHTNWMSIPTPAGGMSVGDVATYVRSSSATTSILADASYISRFWFYWNPSYTTPNVEFDIRVQIWVKPYNEPADFEPYGKYKIPVTVRGKNLFDCSTSKVLHIGSIKNFTRTQTGVIFTANSTTGHVHMDLGLASDYTGKTITASFDIELTNSESLGSTRFVVCDADGQNRTEVSKAGITTDGHYYVTTTLGSDYGEKHLALRLYVSNAVVGTNYDFKNIMVSESATDVPFEPYIEPQTTNVYLNEPLRKIGDYADVIDFKGKKVVRNTLKRVYDGVQDTDNPFNKVDNETSWDVDSANDNFFLCTLSDLLPIIPKNGHADFNHKPLCVQLPVLARVNNSTAASVVAEEQIWYTNAGRNVRLFLSKSREGLGDGSISAFRAYLQANPITVYCAVYEPYEEPIECELPILETKTSIVEVATSLLPSNIKGKYIKR